MGTTFVSLLLLAGLAISARLTAVLEVCCLRHAAATPPGLTITVEAACTEVDGRRLTFHVKAHDGVDLIGEGRHERVVVAWDRFKARVADKAKAALGATA